VAGYYVYRDGSLIATTAFPVYLDSGLTTGTPYSYTVEAFDGRGQASGQTATPATLTLDTPDTTAPPSATSVTATAGNESIQLGWTISNINDVEGFRIYRGASGSVNTTVSPLAVVTATEFQDFDVSAGTTYCYRITTFDAAGNTSAPTAERCATLSGTTPDPSKVSFSSASYSVNETQSAVTITVERSGDLSEAISVDYSASALSATAGDDFTQTSGTLNWTATDSGSKTFSVQIAQDSQVESDETVQLTLSNPSATTSLGTHATATLTITDAPAVSCIDLSPTDITTDTQLSAPCYNVTSDVSVSNNATLTIDPGVRLVFSAGTRLSIDNDGLLLAIGTQAEPITFTSALPTAGYWDGINIDSIATSMLDYAVVEYGGGTTATYPANVAISSGGSLSMNNSTLRHSAGYGFSASNLSGTEISSFSGNTITLNENAPLGIPADMIGDLDTDNSFTGNVTATGGNKDYIQVVSSSSGADILRDQTWHDYGIDYHMPSNRTEIGAALTIAPGITLIFPSGAMLEIDADGTLNAIGTSSEPITFTGLQATAGFWNGIQFTFNHTNNIMQHTVVEYGGGGGNAEANVGVFGSDGMLTIKDSILRNSALNGFYFGNNITLTMENVTTTGNARPGNLDFYTLGLLDKNSSYTGNSDDRLLVTNNTSSSLTSMTIPKLDVPYYFDHTTTMHVPLILTIEPGAELQFNAGGGFNVDNTGAIVAQGTAAEPITFTGAVKTKGYWNGIQVTFSSIPTLFDHTVIEYAGSPDGNTYALIGYFGADTNGSVTNSVLRSSQNHGIWLNASTTGDFTTGNTWEDIDGDDIYYAP
jgi:fibronectin type 3 domain-containing protein